jgi:hypothetical protein
MKIEPEPRRELVIDERLVAELQKQTEMPDWVGISEEPAGEPPQDFDVSDAAAVESKQAPQVQKPEIEDNVKELASVQMDTASPEKPKETRNYDDDDDETLPI